MTRLLASALALFTQSPPALALGMYASISALSLEVLHIPLGPLIYSAIGGAFYMALSAPAAQTRGRVLVSVGLTILGVPAGAMLAVALISLTDLASTSAWTYVAALGCGFSIHSLLPLVADRLGKKVIALIDKAFERLGV
jgi:hypothetical protein